MLRAPTLRGLLAAALLGERTAPEQRIPLADGVLVVRADAHAEIREILWDGAGLMLTLLVFSVAMAVVAWLAAHRALKPVRELEAGLARIARDTGPVRLPAQVPARCGRPARVRRPARAPWQPAGCPPVVRRVSGGGAAGTRHRIRLPRAGM